jgi:hypothetical protein
MKKEIPSSERMAGDPSIRGWLLDLLPASMVETREQSLIERIARNRGLETGGRVERAEFLTDALEELIRDASAESPKYGSAGQDLVDSINDKDWEALESAILEIIPESALLKIVGDPRSQSLAAQESRMLAEMLLQIGPSGAMVSRERDQQELETPGLRPRSETRLERTIPRGGSGLDQGTSGEGPRLIEASLYRERQGRERTGVRRVTGSALAMGAPAFTADQFDLFDYRTPTDPGPSAGREPRG